MIPRNISIIGSGPSGLYTAYHLIKKANTIKIPFNIKIWEKFPIPFGLSRFGVAPDHPEVKNCELTFTSMFENYQKLSDGYCKNLEFIGNVAVDSTIASAQRINLKDLCENQDIVVFSYGCNGDRRLHIPNEDTTNGVFTSRQFVNWYNGQFDQSLNDKFMNFNWSQVKKVGIIGNGNVALDLTRVLISNQINEIWSNTDISIEALQKLKEAPIESIKIFGRRDFLQSKFTNKELRELWELEKYGIYGSIDSKQFEFLVDTKSTKSYDRAMMRRLEMCHEYMLPFDERTKKNYQKFKPTITREEATKTWQLNYLKSPLKINKDTVTNDLKSVTFSQNSMTPLENSNVTTVTHLPSKETTYDLDLLITSLGYQGEPLQGFEDLNIRFERNHIKNVKGRVLSKQDQPLPGLYTSGWISNGGQGVIANTMQGSFQVADEILTDLPNLPSKNNDNNIDVMKHIQGNNRITTWQNWEQINGIEMENGIPYGKPRMKFLTVPSILKNL